MAAEKEEVLSNENNHIADILQGLEDLRLLMTQLSKDTIKFCFNYSRYLIPLGHLSGAAWFAIRYWTDPNDELLESLPAFLFHVANAAATQAEHTDFLTNYVFLMANTFGALYSSRSYYQGASQFKETHLVNSYTHLATCAFFYKRMLGNFYDMKPDPEALKQP